MSEVCGSCLTHGSEITNEDET